MRASEAQELGELVGGPNPSCLRAMVTWSLRACGGIGGEELIDLHGMRQCFAQRPMNMGNTQE